MNRISINPGDRFHRLTVVRELPIQHYPNGSKFRKFDCACDCGRILSVSLGHLRSGHTTGCDECRRSNPVNRTHGMSGTPEHKVWRAMLQRCYNPNNKKYKDYGGRGITVCPEWRESFEQFYADMGDRPSPLHSIERKNNGLGYSAANCTWATKQEQQQNRRANKVIVFRGESKCAVEWARLAQRHPSELYRPYTEEKIQAILQKWLPDYPIVSQKTNEPLRYRYNGQDFTAKELSKVVNMPYHVLWYRLKAGWDVERALTKPVQPRSKA